MFLSPYEPLICYFYKGGFQGGMNYMKRREYFEAECLLIAPGSTVPQYLHPQRLGGKTQSMR